MKNTIDAKVIYTHEKILMDEVYKIQKKLKLERNDIEWNVLGASTILLGNISSMNIISPNDLGFVQYNPNKVWISASIISFPSIGTMIKSNITSPSDDSLTDVILQALAYIEAEGNDTTFAEIYKKYRIQCCNGDARLTYWD